MENILDLLYEYSKKGKLADKAFINKIIKLMIKEKDLREYIKKVRLEDLSKRPMNHSGDNIPIAYHSYTKEILLDLHNMALFQEIHKEFEGSNFEQTLYNNSIVAEASLHEVEHATQLKKSIVIDDNFENLLLGVCCHVENEFFKESKISQLLMLKRNLYLNPKLLHNLKLMNQLEPQFDGVTPVERMADIHSFQEVNNMLVQISKNENIENLTSVFNSYLAYFQLKGYNSSNGIITSPSSEYLEAVKQLNITGMENHFDEHFDRIMKQTQDDSLEKRLLLGLDISKAEYQETQMRLLKNLSLNQ